MRSRRTVRLAFGGRVVRSFRIVWYPTRQVAPTASRCPLSSVAVDAEAFDKRAEALGKQSFAGGRVRRQIGCASWPRTCRTTVRVTLMIPVSQRVSADDTGGNVVSIARVSLDPRNIADDLAGARREIGRAVTRAIDTPDELVGRPSGWSPFIPMRVVGRIADMAFGFTADLPVSCSNVGDCRPNCCGSTEREAEFFWARGMDRNITRSALGAPQRRPHRRPARIGGKVVLVADRIPSRAGEPRARFD